MLAYATTEISSSAGVTIDLLTGTASGGDAQGDTFSGIEDVGGSRYADTLRGDNGDNLLDGERGADTLVGRGGNDIYIVDDVGDVVVESAAEGTDEVRTSLASYTLGAEVENLTSSSSSGKSLIGNSLDNVIAGQAGHDALEGLDGNDTLNGGLGNDSLYGGLGADTLNGELGNDLLDGGSGTDTMAGGWGDDIYVVDDAGDAVTENAGQGTDEVRTLLVSHTLSANVEKLTYTGAVAFAGTGNILANVITGGSHNDMLYGGDGNDRLNGGAGNDYLFGQQNDDHLDGGDGDDSLNGGNNNDTLVGGAGNDTLDGAAGDDMMTGALGNDIYVVDSAGDAVTELSGEGTDTVRSLLASYTLGANLENLAYLGGVAAFTGTGNELANAISGGAFNDVLSGLGGDDSLQGLGGNDLVFGGDGVDVVAGGDGHDQVFGGAGNDQVLGGAGNDIVEGGLGADHHEGNEGNDSYLVDNAGDVVVELAGQGTDLVRAALSSYTLTAHVENLTGVLSTGQTLTGNALNNVINGAAGNDMLYGEAGDDSVNGGGGHDYLFGSDGNDTLSGSDGNDNLNGNNNDDLVVGGAGIDSLGGGAQVDTFRFADGDSGIGASADRIIDFVSGTDKIDLSLIDADGNAAGDQAFSFVGSAAFSGTAGELRTYASGSDTWLAGDTNGDSLADFEIVLTGTLMPLGTDFVL